MAMFDLASVLKDAGAQMGTTQEQIEYIAIDKLTPDPGNFYEMSDIDKLCENIELIGLQQPIRVRRDAENPGRYIIVSGHRRWTALNKLVEDGAEQFSTAPCIVEAEAESAELQELRLIYANADTRKISNAELGKQAARVEELLYKLKEQGVEFPGRMRDHVAEACQVSKSKLQRLMQIQNGLAPDIAKAYYDTGKLSAGAALELSKLDIQDQRYIIDKSVDKPGIDYLTEWDVRARAQLLTRFAALDCPAASGEKCCNLCNVYDKNYATGHCAYPPCQNSGTCCHNCAELATCTKSCVRMAQKKDALKAAAKEKKAEAAARADEIARPKIELVRALWGRMAEALERKNLTYPELLEKIDRHCCIPEPEAEKLLKNAADAKITENTGLPFSWGIHEANIRTLHDFSDVLNCSVDYLTCHDVCNAAPSAQSAAPTWHTDEPPKPGTYAIKFRDPKFGASVDVDIATYGEDTGWCCLLCPDAEVLGWYEIPEV